MSADLQREVYRLQMVGRLRMWEFQFIHLRFAVQKLDGDARQTSEMHLRELESCYRNVSDRHADLLIADSKHWDDTSAALDDAADQMELMLIDFAMQAV